MAVKNGYTNVYWMRDGIKGWKKAGYPVDSQVDLLNKLQELNKAPLGADIISESEAKKLAKCTFVDFRSKEAYDKQHIAGANHVDYATMFSKPMMEELNKSNDLVIIHDTPQVAGTIAATLKLMDYPSVHILK